MNTVSLDRPDPLPCNTRAQSESDSRPLAVDLDGTLIHSDTLWECTRKALSRGPRYWLLLPLWLAKGRAYLKHRLAETARLDPASLPYNAPFLAFLREEKARGRQIFLVTAADQLIAKGIADHLGLFDGVIASDGTTNLKARNKAAALAERFGKQGFVYAGNSYADVPVWQVAASAIPVNTGLGLARRLRRHHAIEKAEFASRPPILRSLVSAIRCYQWVKNALLFVPAITAHTLFDWAVISTISLMFVAFSATASGIYLLNDVHDLDADRSHPRKRERPFASGALPLPFAALSPVLIIAGIAAAWSVSPASGACVVGYTILSVAYSSKLKSKPLIDVFLLAALYTIRVMSGAVALEHSISIWLLSFSGFCFLSLAFVKRTAEISDLHGRLNKQAPAPVGDTSDYVPGRGYMLNDRSILEMMGICSGFMSALVMALYVHSDMARSLYAEPSLIFGLVPLILLWQCRMWLAASRGYMHDDPIVFTAKDRIFWIIVVLSLCLIAVATYGIPA